MSILLINPHGGYQHEYPPLGLLSLCSCLRQQHIPFGFLDEGIYPVVGDQFYMLFAELRPRYLGLSLYTTNISRAFSIITRIKTECPEIIVIVGGPHASALPDETLQECHLIDYLVAGEGEVTLVELIRALDSGNDGQQVSGVYYRTVDGSIRCSGERPYIQNLDELPFPAHDLVHPRQYQYNPISIGTTVASIITSRGCPFNCTFCNKAVFKSKIRRRSPEHVMSEIMYLRELYNIDEIYFQDDLFALDRQWLHAIIASMAAHNLRIPWRMLARVDILDEADYRIARQAGCYLVQFGVESGNNSVLRDIKKNITRSQIYSAFRAARRAGMQTYGFFIFGHRIDTHQTIRETFQLACEIQADFTSFFLLVPFPGTACYQYLPEEQRHDWQRIRYINWERELEPFSICEVSPRDLRQYESQVNREYYGRIQYLTGNILLSWGSLPLMKLKMAWWILNTLARLRARIRGEHSAFCPEKL